MPRADVKPLFNIEIYLDRAQRDFLLESRTCFEYSLRFTRAIRTDHDRFERELRGHNFLRFTAYRTARSGHAHIGRIAGIGFDASDLLTLRPYLAETQRAFTLAREHSRHFDCATFLRTRYQDCLRKHIMLEDCVHILNFLIENRAEVFGLYIRQIPHGRSTKLIGNESLLLAMYARYRVEQESGHERYVESRPIDIQWADLYADFGLIQKPFALQFYADSILLDGQGLRDFHGVLTESNARRYDLRDVCFAIIVENEETFFALATRNNCDLTGMLVICGSGAAIAGARFLSRVLQGMRVYYWGDMDRAGYEIFAAARAILPDLKPLLMDVNALNRYRHLAHSAIQSAGGQRQIPDLDDAYRNVCANGIRIEQEQIPIADALNALQ